MDLASSIDAISTQTSKEFFVPVNCSFVGEPFVISGAISRELLMVVREAVYNAVLHGHPRQITISVLYEAQRLLLTVVDDGVGFPVDRMPAEGHYGVTGMRERMEQIGGSFALDSAPLAGTRVTLSIEREVLLSNAVNGQRWAMN